MQSAAKASGKRRAQSPQSSVQMAQKLRQFSPAWTGKSTKILTGVNGVTKRENGKYFAYINFKRKQIGLGMYDKLEDAITARKKAEELIYAPYLEAHEGWRDDLKKALEEIKKK